ncbi:MAG: glycerophosphoryl diester phosphodiesterase [Halioglobus sp.]|jgi:glycerophosphoryl diester phosphodiesterase
MKRHTTPIIIAHRGASGYLPEHSLAAKALAHAMGADFLEQDVVLTKDGFAIVLHDIYLETTTDVQLRFPKRCREDGRFYALDFTLEEIRELRLHERSKYTEAGLEVAVYPNRFPLGPGTCSIPTLREEIDFIAGLDRSRSKRTGLYVELKAPDWHLVQGYNIAEAVLDVLEQTGYSQRRDQVFLQCFHDKTLKYLRNTLRTQLPLIQLIADNTWGEDGGVNYSHLMTPAGLDAVADYASGIGPWIKQIYGGKNTSGEPIISRLVADAHDRGLQVHPYTFRRDELPDGIQTFEELLDIFVNDVGIDGLFTDFPDAVYAFLRP